MSENPLPSGGVGSSLDMSNPRDRGALRRAMADWPKRFRAITPEKRDNWVNELEDIRSTAKNIADSVEDKTTKLAAVNVVASCIRTSVMMDEMQQREELAHGAAVLKDQHHIEKLDQADRHHADDAKRPSGTQILIVDARGNQEAPRPALPGDVRAMMAPVRVPVVLPQGDQGAVR